MTDAPQRTQDRKSVALLVQLKHPDVGTFAEQWATNLSPGGMFIRTRKPQAVGTRLRFEVKIAGGVRVMRGLAEVRWVRHEGDPAGPPGMGLSFSGLDPTTQQLVDRMLKSSPRGAEGAEEPPSATPAPSPGLTPVAPSIAPLVPPVAPVSRRASDDLPTPVRGVPPVPKPPAPLPFDISEAPPEPPSDVVDLPIEALVAETEPPPPSGAAVDEDEPLDPFDLSFDDEPLELPPRVEPGPRAPVPVPDEAFDVDAALGPPSSEPPPEFDVELDVGEALDLDVEEAPVQVVKPPPRPAAPPPAAPPPLPVSRPNEPGRPRLVFLESKENIPEEGPVLGIDLGTSNSCVAYMREGKPTVIRSKDGYNTVPSVVAITDKGKLHVGHRARSQLVLNPQHTVHGAKRMVGRRFDDPVVKQVREHFHYSVVPDVAGQAAVRLRNEVLSLSEVQGLVLRECKSMAEESLGRAVHRAVVTVPAYYSEPQREAVREAGRLAGLRIERILNEPTAAALAYGLNRQLTRRVLVYDLGGGTFDATVLKVDANVFEVLATGGDTFLGGVDFDNAVVDGLLARFEEKEGVQFEGDRVALARVAEAAEEAKKALSERTSYDVELPMLMVDAGGNQRSLRLTLDREELNALTRPLVVRSLDVVRDVLLDARLRPQDVDDVILVGGQSRMPLVRESLKALFGKAPHAAVNADEAVALGAALYAGTLEKVSDVVLIDVLPMTVGLGLPGGGFRRLIERNTALPAQRGFLVGTGRDGETSLELHLFQGEDAHVGGNEYLGTVRVEGIPPGPKGQEQIAINLRLDGECVLHVDARHAKNTSLPLTVTLSARYDAAQLQRVLAYGEETSRVSDARAKELSSRAGRFWGRIKKALGR